MGTLSKFWGAVMLALARLNLPVQIGTSTLFKYLDEYTYRCVHADEVSSVISRVLELNFIMNYMHTETYQSARAACVTYWHAYVGVL